MRRMDKARERCAELERRLAVAESETYALRAVLRMTLTELMVLQAEQQQLRSMSQATKVTRPVKQT